MRRSTRSITLELISARTTDDFRSFFTFAVTTASTSATLTTGPATDAGVTSHLVTTTSGSRSVGSKDELSREGPCAASVLA